MSSLTFQTASLVLDALYNNYRKRPLDQKSMREISKHIQVSVYTCNKIQNILLDMHLIIKEGQTAGQKIYWNPEKSTPNPTMLQEIYRIYAKDRKSKVRVSKKPGKISLEAALRTLVKMGFAGVIEKSVKDGYRTMKEVIDLSKVEVED